MLSDNFGFYYKYSIRAVVFCPKLLSRLTPSSLGHKPLVAVSILDWRCHKPEHEVRVVYGSASWLFSELQTLFTTLKEYPTPLLTIS